MLQQSEQDFNVHTRLRKQGFGYLKSKAIILNRIADRIPVLLLTDLDQSTCLLEFKHKWLSVPESPNFMFRIAVREVESWILADRSAFADFLKISEARVPMYPDKLLDPKQTLLKLFKHSPKRSLRDEVLPKPHSTSLVGLGYNDIMRHFVAQYWSTKRAIVHSPSLNRAWNRITEFQPLCVENAETDS